MLRPCAIPFAGVLLLASPLALVAQAPAPGTVSGAGMVETCTLV